MGFITGQAVTALLFVPATLFIAAFFSHAAFFASTAFLVVKATAALAAVFRTRAAGFPAAMWPIITAFLVTAGTIWTAFPVAADSARTAYIA
ncbi:MAG TPA: hypothetical protein PK054_04265 [Anaerohalosphaeraceae bacterium]|nr:hypothetical protein [Anaerohalosphaeraceae bacterium]HOL87716.1 hypothetical protein [Anaerohalosphaeraceae bacterium]HPP55777.1 hypothetical protein [Anaerohalosphaeraceae bacterium]